MDDKWFYVMSGERQGPVSKSEIESLYAQGKLGDEDYIWKKGFENWMKIQDVGEFGQSSEPLDIPEPMPKHENVNLATFDRKKKNFFVKTGADRGREEVEYGPFSLELLKKLYNENRINGKTFVFCPEMTNWKPLADVEGFQDVFEQAPPVIQDDDRRAFRRKPFIARMFIENKNQVFEGICRDVSVGGMQVLVDNFPIQVGERVSINAHPENSDYHFTASGEIVRMLEGGLGFSFRFISLSDEAVKAINSYTSHE